ncbi:M23 family metallopeptidase [Treponema pedis]|uniref:M23 family metallopeptidase n=1 Tax=Treponema pedis TaxID=409322 RepID=UPI0004228F5D|nr:M23 family metallopeptidase [Treponema pedis]
MKKNILQGFLFCITFFSAYTLSWPTDTVNFLTLFGQAEEAYGEFSNGITFKDAGTVRIANYGKHLITMEEKDDNHTFPCTLGNTAIFIHDDEMQTVYGNLTDRLIFTEGAVIDTGSVIGQTGSSAWSEPNSLIFQVLDTTNNASINPLPLLIPSAKDETPPQIQNTVLISEGRQPVNLSEAKTVKKGSYDLYASIIDKTEKNGAPLAPYRVSIFINGINTEIIFFEVLLSGKDGIYLQNTKLTAKALYQKKGFMYLGKINLTTGKVDLSINARDIIGNEKTETFSFQVE